MTAWLERHKLQDEPGSCLREHCMAKVEKRHWNGLLVSNLKFRMITLKCGFFFETKGKLLWVAISSPLHYGLWFRLSCTTSLTTSLKWQSVSEGRRGWMTCWNMGLRKSTANTHNILGMGLKLETQMLTHCPSSLETARTSRWNRLSLAQLSRKHLSHRRREGAGTKQWALGSVTKKTQKFHPWMSLRWSSD